MSDLEDAVKNTRATLAPIENGEITIEETSSCILKNQVIILKNQLIIMKKVDKL